MSKSTPKPTKRPTPIPARSANSNWAAFWMSHPTIPHGTIRICFTCDEEVGHGVDHIDLSQLGAHIAYTLDGGGVGEIDGETFSADLAVVTITGVNVHPGIAKGKMVN